MNLPERSLETILAEERAILAELGALVGTITGRVGPAAGVGGAGEASREHLESGLRKRLAGLLAGYAGHFREEEAHLESLSAIPECLEKIAAHRHDHAVIGNWLAVIARSLATPAAGDEPWPELMIAHAWLRDHYARHDAVLAYLGPGSALLQPDDGGSFDGRPAPQPGHPGGAAQRY